MFRLPNLFKSNRFHTHLQQNVLSRKLFSTKQNTGSFLTNATTKLVQQAPLMYASTATISTFLITSPYTFVFPPYVALEIGIYGSLITTPCAYIVSQRVWKFWKDDRTHSWWESLKLTAAGRNVQTIIFTVVFPSSFLAANVVAVVFFYTSAPERPNASLSESVRSLIYELPSTSYSVI